MYFTRVHSEWSGTRIAEFGSFILNVPYIIYLILRALECLRYVQESKVTISIMILAHTKEVWILDIIDVKYLLYSIFYTISL